MLTDKIYKWECYKCYRGNVYIEDDDVLHVICGDLIDNLEIDEMETCYLHTIGGDSSVD